MAKFTGLWSFFNGLQYSCITLTFDQIEGLIGEPLCASARKYRAYWHPGSKHPIVHCWLDNDYHIDELDLNVQRITFQKRKMIDMPLISSFLGILIYMFKEKYSPHHKPHIHAVFAGDKMSIASDGEILAGNLPRKQQKYVEAWVALREDEINAAWVALNENSEIIKIKGLES